MNLWRWYAQHDLDDVDSRIDGLVEAETEEEAVKIARTRQAGGYTFGEFAWDVWVVPESREAAIGEEVLRAADRSE